MLKGEREGRMQASGRKTRKAERKERTREGGERFCRGAPKQALEDRSPSCHEYSHAQYLGANRDYLPLNFQFHHRLPLYASCKFPFSKKLRGKTARRFSYTSVFLSRKVRVRMGGGIGIEHSDVPGDVRMNVSRGGGDVINQKAAPVRDSIAFSFPANSPPNKGEDIKRFPSGPLVSARNGIQ